MSLYDYRVAIKILTGDPPFYALIQAAMRKADRTNIAKLEAAWPEIWDEFCARHKAPGGLLPEEIQAPEKGE